MKDQGKTAYVHGYRNAVAALSEANDSLANKDATGFGNCIRRAGREVNNALEIAIKEYLRRMAPGVTNCRLLILQRENRLGA
jgi:hypothetical protein